MTNIVNLERDMNWLNGLPLVTSVTSSIDNETGTGTPP